MKVIGYVRVSTEDQAREGISLEAQQARVEAYCIAKGWELLGVEADSASAKDMNRPGLQRCLQQLNAETVEALIIYKLDRLTRSVVDLNTLVALMERHHVALVSIEESLDATTPTGRLMMNLLASVSQWEREIIGERTKAAMGYLKARHRVYSRPVYGYNNTDGTLHANEEEQAVIEQAKKWRAKGMTYRRIAASLNADGVPTKRGGTWQHTTVRYILTRA